MPPPTVFITGKTGATYNMPSIKKLIVCIEILVLCGILFISCTLLGDGNVTFVSADVLSSVGNIDEEFISFLQPISDKEIIYTNNDIGTFNEVLKKRNLFTKATEELNLGEIDVGGMTFIKETQTILVWGKRYETALRRETDSLLALDKNLNLKWEKDTDISMPASLRNVLFIEGAYYAQDGRTFVEMEQDGAIVKTHTFKNEDIMFGLSPFAQGNKIVFGGIDEYGDGRGVITICEKADDIFLTTSIYLDKEYVPLDGNLSGNKLLVLSVYSKNTDKRCLDIIDVDQKKAIQGLDVSKFYDKYDTVHLEGFELIHDGKYVRMLGIVEKGSRYYKKGARSLVFYVDIESKEVEVFAIKPDLDYPIRIISNFSSNGSEKINLIVKSSGIEIDRNEDTTVLEINKSDLPFE
jgi:hypothetical protein